MFDFLANHFSSLFASLGRSGKLTENNIAQSLDSIKTALLEADVPYELVETFCAEIKQEVVGQKVIASLKPAEQLAKIVYEKIKFYLSGGQQTVPFSFQLPSVVMVMGLQGSGKTTSIGKMAHWLKKEAQSKGKQRRILVASVDYYRPAAIDQLEIIARNADVSFFRATSTDPVRAAIEIHNYYKKELFEILLLDTAGRLHVDNTMLAELQAIDAQLSPKYKILVLDAMTGQESLNIALAFDQTVGFGLSFMSKMDSDSRGGAVLSFRYSLKKPIVFTGTGEKLEDIELFYPDRMASRILGMGDIVTLAEKANEKIKQSEQEKAYKAFSQGNFTLQDFANQISMMNQLGSFSQLAKYLPAIGGQNLSSDTLEKGEKELKRCQAIINSMTPKERLNHKILDGSRKNRIALGAGVTVSDINLLIQRFEESQQYAKLFKKLGKFNNLFK